MAAEAAVAPAGGYTLAEVAKHKTKDDCWVAVNGKVLDVTKFLPDHPGGALAILTFAGKDASEEFNMIHPPDVIEKYAPDAVIGDLVGAVSGAVANAPTESVAVTNEIIASEPRVRRQRKNLIQWLGDLTLAEIAQFICCTNS
jgi:cytochrome b involved in lipid metabolism